MLKKSMKEDHLPISRNRHLKQAKTDNCTFLQAAKKYFDTEESEPVSITMSPNKREAGKVKTLTMVPSRKFL